MHTSGQPAGCAGRPGHLLVTHARVGPPATGIVGSPTSDPLVGGRLGHLPVSQPFWLKGGAMVPAPPAPPSPFFLTDVVEVLCFWFMRARAGARTVHTRAAHHCTQSAVH